MLHFIVMVRGVCEDTPEAREVIKREFEHSSEVLGASLDSGPVHPQSMLMNFYNEDGTPTDTARMMEVNVRPVPPANSV